MAKEMNERDAKLAQWLNEAYAKEAELEADLAAHIALTQKAPYKKRLQAHLKETREHKRAVARRIKQLGGTAGGAGVPGVPSVVGEAAGKTVSAVKGQVGAARAMVTEQAETHMRNAQEELREEQVEIALYTRIETFATEVGDKETSQLAKRIRREEERMAKYLTAELGRLVKDVVRAEVPRDQRATPRRRTSTRSRAGAGSGSGSGSRSTRSPSGSRSTSRSSSGSRSARSTGSSSSGSRSARSTGSSSSGSRSARSTGSSSSGSRSARSTGSSSSGSRASRSTTGRSSRSRTSS
jgi:ferritin-like metal-binding protein YciE